ncbi:MAG: hypothetical protein JNJ47_08765 [Alphaproteobacteria bacterium]|nr:hypothetical protein [Alphaproteobacteria bacterium]
MAVVSIRFNKAEEKVLNLLSKYFDFDRSTLIKRAILEKYEDLSDLETIENFESKEKSKGVAFLSSDEILNELKIDRAKPKKFSKG